MKINISKWIFRALFFGFTALGIGLVFSEGTPEIVIQNDADYHAENDGKLVFVKGRPTFTGRTSDSDLGISIPAPVLRRVVHRDGIYSGMGFPYNINGRLFVSDITLGGTLKIESKFTKLLLLDFSRAEINQAAVFSRGWNDGWKDVGRLPEKALPEGLVYRRNMYSAPDGEPKFEISYRGYLIPKDIGTFTAFGFQRNGIITFDGNVSRFYDGPVDPRRIRRSLRQKARYPFMGAMLFALPFLVLGWRRDDD